MKLSFKILASSIVLSFVTAANANSMEGVFNELNGTATYGGPAAIQTQTMNYYHGGNITLATPTRSYNLVTAQAPSINAGCGGIDLHMGGFSFISKEQFVQLLRNIGSNALGYGFKIALQNICPTCENVMTSLQNVADRINQFNINSCQAAKGIVHAAANEVFNTQYDTKVMDWGMVDGIYRDGADAYRNVKNVFNKDKRREALEAARRRNPARKDELPTGNVTWEALSKVNGLSVAEKRLFMGMVGTVIFNNNGGPETYQPTDNISRDMISKQGRMKMRMPVCSDNYTDCLRMNWESYEMVPTFKDLVLERMKTMQSHISQRRAYGGRQNELLAFVNATEIPVYKIVALSASLNNQGVGTEMITKYSELIAAKYAQAYIGMVSNTMRKALNNARASGSFSHKTDEIIATLENVQRIESQLALDIEQLYNAAHTSYIVAQEVKMIENTLLSNMTTTIANSLNFGNSLR